MIAFVITYNIGCLWWLIVGLINNNEDIDNDLTFKRMWNLDELFQDPENVNPLCYKANCIKHYLKEGKVPEEDWGNAKLPEKCKWENYGSFKEKNCPPDNMSQAIISCYYALTTLSTVGYGDYFPISINEMIVGIIFMLVGIVFFSQILSSFIEIIQNYDQRMGNDDKGSDLNDWMTLLTRFTNRPLSKQLIGQIDGHFSFYWAKNRLNSITKDDEYLNQCPRRVKNYIMIEYLFDDIIYKHRRFFGSQENRKSKFLYDVCFGFKPQRFVKSESVNLILDEENEVTDMYFIQEGIVGIGYYLLSQGLSKQQYNLDIEVGSNGYICDYYVCHNKKSEFIYICIENVEAIALSKKYLVDYLFPKYPQICHRIKENSEKRYTKNVRDKLMEKRQAHIIEVNKQSPYKQIKIQDKKKMVNQEKVDQKDIESSFLKRQFRITGDEDRKEHISTPNDSSFHNESTSPTVGLTSKKTGLSGGHSSNRTLLSANM